MQEYLEEESEPGEEENLCILFHTTRAKVVNHLAQPR